MYYENIPGVDVEIKDGGLVIPESGGSETMLIVAPSLSASAPDEAHLIRTSVDLELNGFGGFYVGQEVNPIAAEWKAAIDGGCKRVFVAALKEISMERAEELEQAAIDHMVQAVNGSPLEVSSVIAGTLTDTTEEARRNRLFIGLHDLLFGTLLDFNADHFVVKGVDAETVLENMHPAFFPDLDEIANFPFINGIYVSSHVIESGSVQYPVEITTGTNDVLEVEIGGVATPITLEAKMYDGNTHTLATLAQDIEAAALLVNVTVKVREQEGRLFFYFAEQVVVTENTTATVLQVSGKKSAWKRTKDGIIVRGSYAQALSDYCKLKTLMQNAAVGYIGTSSPIDTRAMTIRTHVDKLSKMDTDFSPYLQVVANETAVIIPGSQQTHFINGATHYAALVSNLKAESAPTNKVVKGVKYVRFNYSLRQLSQLTGNKIVTFRQKGNQLVVTDGVTTAPKINFGGVVRESDYSRLSTLRITQICIQVVREAAEPFIGEPNGIPQYSSLKTVIRGALEKVREAGAIMGYNFNVIAANARLDKAIVTLEIVPAFELRRISVEVNLVPSADILSAVTPEEETPQETFFKYSV